jgi:recombinase-like zinc beta ribbon protein
MKRRQSAATHRLTERTTVSIGCSNARNRGLCQNKLTIRRDVLEASVLEGLKSHLMHPDLVR